MTPRNFGERIIKKLTAGSKGARLEGRWGRIEIETADIDRLGVLVREIRIDRLPGPSAASALRQRLRELAERLDYLPERLVLVEHDPARTGTLMRSLRPRGIAGERVYFELRVEMDRSTHFRRFRQPPGGVGREVTTILLDRHTLAHLVDDLMAAVAV